MHASEGDMYTSYARIDLNQMQLVIHNGPTTINQHGRILYSLINNL